MSSPRHGLILAGRFHARAQIGYATLGWLYRAVDERSNREVALRLILGIRDPESTRDRLAALIDRSSKLRDPGLAPLLDCGVFEGQLWFAVEWVDGHALESLVTKGGALPAAEVARIGIAVAGSLAAAHAEALVHRGLTTRTIFVDGARIKTLELGVAAAIFADTPFLTNTPGSMPPEQIANGPIDERSDVYSLGCCLFTAAVGRPAFGGPVGSGAEMRAAQAGWRSPRARDLNPAVPEGLELILLRAMAVRPDDRFQSMRAFAGALTEWQTSLTP